VGLSKEQSTRLRPDRNGGVCWLQPYHQRPHRKNNAANAGPCINTLCVRSAVSRVYVLSSLFAETNGINEMELNRRALLRGSVGILGSASLASLNHRIHSRRGTQAL
jgi:hypothetical protein